MILGITGTRTGLQPKQSETLARFLKASNAKEFHHGDCVGVDAQAAELMYQLNEKCSHVSHPANVKAEWRAHMQADKVMPAKHPLERNKDIVNASDIMLACPKEFTEVLRGSGTWATIRYAFVKNKRMTVIYPDGSYSHDLRKVLGL